MNKLEDLIDLITTNLDSPEKEKLIAEIEREPDKKKLYSRLKTTWALIASERQMPNAKVETAYRQVKVQLSRNRAPRLISLVRLKYAASIALLIGLSVVMFYWGRYSKSWDETLVVNSVIAPKGEISKVILPDSTVVWLNSGTTLKYDNHFALDNRHLTISGQAYLAVKRNEDLPLVVSTGQIDVKVLGTKFDVCAYPEEGDIQVVLESGKVELLRSEDRSFLDRLKPGQMAKYDILNHKLSIEDVQPNTYMSWKEGELLFKDAPMSNVIKRLERRFDVAFVVKDPGVYRSVLTGNFRTEGLKEIMEYIRFSCQINYSIQKDSVSNTSTIILHSK